MQKSPIAGLFSKQNQEGNIEVIFLKRSMMQLLIKNATLVLCRLGVILNDLVVGDIMLKNSSFNDCEVARECLLIIKTTSKEI